MAFAVDCLLVWLLQDESDLREESTDMTDVISFLLPRSQLNLRFARNFIPTSTSLTLVVRVESSLLSFCLLH